jgi:hypothetical protein
MNAPNRSKLLVDEAAAPHGLFPETLYEYMLHGDVTTLSESNRVALIIAICKHIGLDPIEQPFLLIHDNGRVQLYASRRCAAALCRTRRISRELVSKETIDIDGVRYFEFVVRATMVEDGRVQDGIGVVPLLMWDKERKDYRAPDPIEMANLRMKCHTKANRRAALDAVGLGIPDESEIPDCAIDVTPEVTISQAPRKRLGLQDLVASETSDESVR